MSKRLGIKRSALHRLSENMSSIMASTNSKRVKQSPKSKLKICKKLKLKPDPTRSFLCFDPNETIIPSTTLEMNKNNISKQRTISKTWTPPLKVGCDFESINKWKNTSRDGNMECVPNIKDFPHCSKNPISSSTSAKLHTNETVTKMECEPLDTTNSKYSNPFNINYKVNIADNYPDRCSEDNVNEEPSTVKLFGLTVNTQCDEISYPNKNNQIQTETENILSGFDKNSDFKDTNYNSTSELEFGLNFNYRAKEERLDEISTSQTLSKIPCSSNKIVKSNNYEADIKFFDYKNSQEEIEIDSNETQNFGETDRLFKDNEKFYCEEGSVNLVKYRNFAEVQRPESIQIYANENRERNSSFMEIDLTTDNDNEESQHCSQKMDINEKSFKLDNENDFNDHAASANTIILDEDKLNNADEISQGHEMLKGPNSLIGKPQTELHDQNTSNVNSPSDKSLILSQIGTSKSLSEEQKELSYISNDNSSNSSASGERDIKDISNEPELENETVSCFGLATVESPLLNFNENEDYNNSINEDKAVSHDATQDTILLEDKSDTDSEKSKDNTLIIRATQKQSDDKSSTKNSEANDLIDSQSHNSGLNNSDILPPNTQKSQEWKVLNNSAEETQGENDFVTPCEQLTQHKKYEDMIECSDDFYNIPMSQVIKIENEYKETTKNEVMNKLESDQSTSKGTKVDCNQTSVLMDNDIVALPLPQPPKLDWIKKQNEEKHKLRSILQEINHLNSIVLQARKEIWPQQFNPNYKK